MVSAKILFSMVLAATGCLAAPTVFNETDLDLLLPTVSGLYNCGATQGGLISYNFAEGTIHQAPLGLGKSGYPHRFYNAGKHPLRPNSSAFEAEKGSLFEFPVFADGHFYPYNVKPKANPGPARVLYTTPNKDFCGVITHNSGNTRPFHSCPLEVV